MSYEQNQSYLEKLLAESDYDLSENEEEPFEDDGTFANDPDFNPKSCSGDSSESDEISESEKIEQETLGDDIEDIIEDEMWTTECDEIPDFNFDGKQSGIKIPITPFSTAEDIFGMIWSKQILENIVQCTNKYAKRLCERTRPFTRNQRIKVFKETDVNEMKKFLGLCLLQGQLSFPKLRHMSSKSPLYYHPIFSTVMSGRRFEQLLRCINCENEEDKGDKLSKIRCLLDQFIKNSQEAYYPEEALSLDESLLLHRGRLSFRQYMKGKKAKYGIKLYELCSANSYVFNIEIYKGKVDGSENKLSALVKRLMAPYLNKGHHLL